MEREKLNFPLPIVVEGKYDKIKLSQVTSAHIITTDGFGIFNKKEKLALIKRLARDGIVVLCDSDGAGSVIRGHIMSAVPREKIYNLYIPQIAGKEKRKKSPSKEGTLGVEGMSEDMLYDMLAALCRRLKISGGARAADNALTEEKITKARLFEDGLSGHADSARKRDALADYFSLPHKMTPNAMLGALNILTDYSGYKAALEHLRKIERKQ